MVVARLRFNMLVIYWYIKVNWLLIKDFTKRNVLYATVFILTFLIQWLLGNGIWYYIAVTQTGWLRGFALAYLGFLWSPFAIEKLVYIFVSTICAKFVTNKVFKKSKRIK